VQGLVQQDAGVIAGKRAAGGVGAMLARCQADDDHPRGGIAERRDRAAEITRVFGFHLFEEIVQAAATGAVNIEMTHYELVR